jgi:hypothetical protein
MISPRVAPRLVLGLCWLAVALPACSDEGDDSGTTVVLGPLHISAQPEAVVIKPNESNQVSFRLQDAKGAPAPDRILRFLITDPLKAHGATLAFDRGISDSRGEVRLPIIAGTATDFIVRASAATATDIEVMVIVDSARYGPVEVVPEVQAPDEVQSLVTALRLYFFPGAACRDVTASTAGSVDRMRSLTPGMTSVYANISAGENHAVLGQGLDSTGVVLVGGCVDFPGRAIETNVVARVVLPLRPLRPVIAGSYRATSILQFRPAPKAVGQLSDIWNETVACPSDPARLWLDCTIDALTSTSGDDPLDCRPTAADDAAFDGRLAARRGLPLAASPGGRCRGELDGAGRPALEPQVRALLAGPAGTMLVAHLGAMATETVTLLNAFKLHSAMVVSATTAADRFQVDHTLEALELTVMGEPVAVDLFGLALPARSARFVPGVVQGDELTLATHGFTLRLGTAARVAFERGALARQGHPPTTEQFIAALFGTATYTADGVTTTGCAALDALVCPLAGASTGCLTDACTRGTAALGQRLSGAFAGLDGDDLDLMLGGSVSIFDRDGDGRAEALGLLLPGTSDPGVWSGQLRTSAEQSPLSGIWTADRVP